MTFSSSPHSLTASQSHRPSLLFRIGTRGSALARWQADWVERALRRAAPEAGFEQVMIKTTGDLMPTQPLEQLGGRGAFTRELDAALLDQRIDLAVHSAKDYPTDVPPDLVVAAFPCRWPVNDALIARRGGELRELPPNALIGTGSLRRSAQLRQLRSDLRFAEIRGNIDTRLRKLDEGQYDAIVMAEAALRRLRIDRAREVLPVTKMVPDAGQGALMIVCRRADRRLRRLLGRINDPRVSACVHAERAVLAGLGGGCRLPLGVYAKIAGGRMKIRAVVISPDASRRISLVADCAPGDAPQTAKQIIRDLLKRGAREILDEVERAAH